MATLKPTTPLLTPNTGPLKPASPLRPKTAPKTPISHPQRRWRFQSRLGRCPQRRWRFQITGPAGLQGQAAAPVAGGWAWPGFETTHPATLQRHSAAGVKGAGGICRGAGGRWRGLAGLRDDAPSEARGADGSRAGRRPPAHTAAGPSGTRPPVGTQNRPAPRVRAAQSVSEAHRRITTMSGSPRPLSWRTLEIPSLAAISFAVPSMRGSS